MKATDYTRNSSGRLFDNEFVEACSKVHPATPFAFYIPLVAAAWIYAARLGLTGAREALLFFPLGWVTWDLMEYGIHRKFFHWEGNGPFTRRFHDIIHGYHHKYPDDAMRLVMPLGASIPMAIVIAGLLWLLAPASFGFPFFAGIVGGYLFYDFTHWSTHYRKPLTEWGRRIRSHHMAHHFACPDKNFGISHRWIDVIFGSLKRRDERG